MSSFMIPKHLQINGMNYIEIVENNGETPYLFDT